MDVPPTQKPGRPHGLGVPLLWRLGVVGIVAVVLAMLFPLLKSPASNGLENGIFANDCCGSLELRDGDLILNRKVATRYAVGRDARGFYVLPRSYVGSVEDIGFEVDGARPATKLRFDHIPHPTELMVQGSRKTYTFRRNPTTFPRDGN